MGTVLTIREQLLHPLTALVQVVTITYNLKNFYNNYCVYHIIFYDFLVMLVGVIIIVVMWAWSLGGCGYLSPILRVLFE